MEILATLVFVAVLYLFIIKPIVSVYRQGRHGKQPRRTKQPDGFNVEVVGEASYQVNLLEICGAKQRDGVEKLVFAELVPEDDNQHDKMAVRVDVDGKTVGYLSRPDARSYRDQYDDDQTRCAAVIVGGWDRGNGDTGHFGVRLSLSLEPS